MVSIVCAVMNRTQALRVALASWVLQGGVQEIVIVDWSSTIPVDPLATMDDRIRIVRVENERRFHLAAALNLAADCAAQPVLLKLDADYVLNPYYDFCASHPLPEQGFFTGPGLVEVAALLQSERRRASSVKPGVAATQSDQIAVEIQNGRCGIGGSRRRTELWADGVVTSGALLLDSPVTELVARVDRRYPAGGEQDDQRQSYVLGMPQLAGDAGHVVVADEGLRHETLEEPVVTLQRPVQFVEVAVIETAPYGLPQFVLGNRVHPGVLDETAVVTVNDLGDKPGIRMGLPHAG